MAQVTITVSSNAQAYWVAVDDKDVDLMDGVGVVHLPPGDHILSWWLVGAAGQQITIAVTKDDGTLLTRIPNSVIPKDRAKGGGVKMFAL